MALPEALCSLSVLSSQTLFLGRPYGVIEKVTVNLSTNTTEQRKTATLVLIRHSCFSCYWLFTHGTWNIGISRTSILWENLAPNVLMFWFVIVQMLYLYCNWESLYNPAAGLKNKIKLNYVNTTSHFCSTLHPNSSNMNWPNTGSFCPRSVTVLLNPLCRQEKTSHSETKRPTRTILLVNASAHLMSECLSLLLTE